MTNYVLFDAAFSDDAGAIVRAVNSGADPNQLHPQGGNTPLQVASQCKSLAAVNALLRLGADPNLRFDWKSMVDGRIFHDRVALMYASTAAIARRLIEAGADVNAIDANGWSALARAVECVNLEVFNELLSAGADSTFVSNIGGKAVTLSELAAEKFAYLERIEGQPPKPEVTKMMKDLSDIKATLKTTTGKQQGRALNHP
jgi:ankyrin repeat protein